MAYKQLISSLIKESEKYPELSQEEEIALFTEYNLTNDINIRNRIIKHNIKLVIKFANKFPKEEDYINEGFIGLVKGIEKFNLDLGYKLSTYVSFWIKAFMFSYLLKNYRLVRFDKCTLSKKLFFRLKREKAHCLNNGINPTEEVLAERLGVSREAISNAEIACCPELRIDTYEDFDCSATVPILNEKIDWCHFNDIIQLFKQRLEGKELCIFEERILKDRPLRDVGDDCRLSHEGIRKIQLELVKLFKKFLLQNNLDFSGCQGVDFGL